MTTSNHDILGIMLQLRQIVRDNRLVIERIGLDQFLTEAIDEADGGFTGGDTMPRVKGKSFRCSCGCNVFAKHATLMKFRCNSCAAVFEGESAEASP
jgi:hypothetical protein